MRGNVERRWRGMRLSLTLWAGAGLILLLPLVAMQFTAAVRWSLFDFAVAGALLAGVCLALELASRRSGSLAYRGATLLALGAAAGVLFLNGAVGIIGSEREDANTLYMAVLAVAGLGAAAARFRASGMAWAMAGTALAQVLAPAVAATFSAETRALVWTPQVLVLTGVFAGLWLASAQLFRSAAQ
jgi:hypothetical protein